MFRPNSGRPGTAFAYTLPGAGAGAAPRPARPLVFGPVATYAPTRATVATVAPVIHHAAPSACRLDGRTVLYGAVIGGAAMIPTGAGVLPGVAGGALAGAGQAISDKNKCESDEKKAAFKAYKDGLRR